MCEDRNKWIEAIEEEKESLRKNNTWRSVDKTDTINKKPIRTKWVFKIKQDGRYKARLVAKGCEQKSEIDYTETYSPVISTIALRSLFAIAAAKKQKVLTFDIKTAFLYGDLSEEIYIYPLEGYDNQKNLFKLEKALYGLKQTPLCWNKRFSKFLEEKNLEATESEPCIFKKRDSSLIIEIYVDDGLIICDNETEIEQLIKDLENEFEINITYEPTMFVGFEINIENNKIKLSQKEYIESLLERTGMKDARRTNIPMQPGVRRETKSTVKNFPYREIIGSLLYISTKTRPDITFSVNYSGRFVNRPTQEHISDVKHIIRYLKGNTNQRLEYKNTDELNTLKAYCDADLREIQRQGKVLQVM